jgi:hypothetical protein
MKNPQGPSFMIIQALFQHRAIGQFAATGTVALGDTLMSAGRPVAKRDLKQCHEAQHPEIFTASRAKDSIKDGGRGG